MWVSENRVTELPIRRFFNIWDSSGPGLESMLFAILFYPGMQRFQRMHTCSSQGINLSSIASDRNYLQLDRQRFDWMAPFLCFFTLLSCFLLSFSILACNDFKEWVLALLRESILALSPATEMICCLIDKDLTEWHPFSVFSSFCHAFCYPFLLWHATISKSE